MLLHLRGYFRDCLSFCTPLHILKSLTNRGDGLASFLLVATPLLHQLFGRLLSAPVGKLSREE